MNLHHIFMGKIPQDISLFQKLNVWSVTTLLTVITTVIVSQIDFLFFLYMKYLIKFGENSMK